MGWLRALALPLAIAGVVLVTASAMPVGRTVTITMRYSHFLPASVEVPAGVPITFVLDNEDPIGHEWIVGDEATHRRHRTGTEPHHGERATEQSIDALASVRTTVTFAKPGTYRYICHLPGHEQYGMVGVVRVTDG
ncbi:MAG: cupredoxin domain-containing protein [Chloroflexota bacterium]